MIKEIGKHPSLEHQNIQISGIERRRRVRNKLVSQFIFEDPDHPGSKFARIGDGTYPVWAVIKYAQGEIDPSVKNKRRQCAIDYGLPSAAINAAFVYYNQHREEIDEYIREHDIKATE